MEMIWQLFGVHITLFLIILFLFIVWLIIPRRLKKVRLYTILACCLVLIGSILTGLVTYWPKAYDKAYLNQEVPTEVTATPLKALADSIDFHIGVAINPAHSDYEYISSEFNSITAENNFKPGKLLKDAESWEFDFSIADSLLDYAIANNLRMRGHTLIWGKFPGMTHPKVWTSMVQNSPDPEAEMKKIIKKYIETVMGHFKGKVNTWDVVNEPMSGEGLFPSIFTEAMGEDYIDYSFQIAHEIDPECELILNEAIGNYDGPQGKAFLSLLRRLIDRGVPIDGVGLQTHQINKIHDIAALKNYISEIGKLGLNVEITELDIRLLLFDEFDDPYQAQGDQYYEIVKACLEDPSCNGVTMWGLSDDINWMDKVPPFQWKSPNAPNILDEDLNIKPAFTGIWKALKEGSLYNN
jgi:endo-1,4-beta-xylanase